MNTSNGYIQLGGNLDQATTINTTSSNTLSIMGLQSGSATDSLVVVDPTAGTLKRISPSKLTTGQYVSTYSATMGQTTFLAPLTVTDANKIQVFRNGSLVGFTTTVGSNNVTIDFSNYDNGYLSGCLASDQIKIYQWK